MSLKNHAYYLHHLGLPQWCERAKSSIKPFTMVMPSQAKFLFVINIDVIDLVQFEHFLLNIALSLGCGVSDFAYVIYDNLRLSNYNFSDLQTFIQTVNPVVLLLGDKGLLKEFTLNVQPINDEACLMLSNKTNWQSPDSKKMIMNWFLLNDFI